ncbi:invasion associated locus B family protein [Roseobacter sp. AzwK-3b]|uniref:invasion associated locus B family protein n=1 Tax=Roseobacter sp. AzwK-3b TaxID=351016 RepID=UPI00055AACA0|nr:invasion associated locus B family protein [Roseobacter sp. AzwK-3b]
MPRLLHLLPLVALLGMSTSLAAQDTATGDSATDPAQTTQPETAPETAQDPSAAEPETPGEAAQPDEELDLGRPARENPNYIKEQYGDWQLRCFRSGGEEDPCQMYQLLTEEAGNPVAEFSLFRLPEGAQAVAGATIIVPLGTLLSEELKLSVDGGRAKTYAFSFCTMVGCYARIGFTQADIDAFKAGGMANLQIVPAQAPDQVVDIKASLSGFTAAYDNVTIVDN